MVGTQAIEYAIRAKNILDTHLRHNVRSFRFGMRTALKCKQNTPRYEIQPFVYWGNGQRRRNNGRAFFWFRVKNKSIDHIFELIRL